METGPRPWWRRLNAIAFGSGSGTWDVAGRCVTFRGAVSHERRHVRISDMRRDGYATSSQENVVARTLGSFALFS